MPEAWVEQKTARVGFGDARRDRHRMQIRTAFGSQPQASVPAATGNRNDREAAYEFFANERVTPEAAPRRARRRTPCERGW